MLRFAASLNEKGKKLEAVELYRRANRPTDAALLINEIAEQVRECSVLDYVRATTLFISRTHSLTHSLQ